jgi:hypothetical protein
MPKLNFIDYFLTEADKTTHVTTFMRTNPMTIAHEGLVNHVKRLATDLDANHSIVLSHTHDGDKNPLTPEQKLRHAKVAFPGANVSTSSPESPSLMHHAAKLYANGVRNLHLVVGDDRVDQFRNLLQKYNGQEGAHGHFNFDNITVHSAGRRDPDAEGIEGVSGTRQRELARNGDFEGFRAGAPSAMNDQQTMNLYNDIRNAKPPEKEPKKPTTKKKPIKEELTTVAAGEMVRGFGDVCGTPAVSQTGVANYVDQNTQNSDQKNDILKAHKEHASKHNLVGFKAYHDNLHIGTKKFKQKSEK